MYRQKALDGFQFNNYFIFHQNIDPIAGLKPNTVGHHGQWELRNYFHIRFRQFMNQANLVCALEEAGSESCVNLHRSANDIFRDFIQFHQKLCALGVLCGYST